MDPWDWAIEASGVGAVPMRSTSRRTRIILVTYGSLGDVQPFLAIGAALRDRGKDTVIATSEIYREQVAASGLEFIPVRPDRRPCQQDPDFLDRLLRGGESPSAIFRHMFLPALRESVDDLMRATEDVSAIVTHPLATGARLVAEARGLPWVSAVMQPMGYLSAYEPPVVGPGWVSASLRALGPGKTGVVHGAARALTGVWMREWHAVRADLGLPKSESHPLWDGQHSDLRSIGLFPRVLGEAQPDWPASARICGFPFYRGADNGLNADLQRFLNEGEPPVVFTLGTTAVHDPGTFYEESAAAAERLGLRAVLIMHREGQGQQWAWPSGVIAVPHAPHHELFPRALAVVHQAGIGTLSEAMLARKPMLIMPYGHDQADNAWRANRLGVARIVPRHRYRRNAVARVLDRLLSDAAMSASLRRVGDEMDREQGAETAASLVDKALSRRSVRTPGEVRLC